MPDPNAQPSTAALSAARRTREKDASSSPDVAPSELGGTAPSVAGSTGGGTLSAKNVASPGELCGFVDTLLTQLEGRFDDMSEQVLSRSGYLCAIWSWHNVRAISRELASQLAALNEMSGRIDSLETAIADLMHGSVDSGAGVPPQQRKATI